MGTYLLGLYLKLNLLLGAALLLWLLTKALMRLLGIEVSHARQLVIARYLFCGLLLVVPVIVLLNLTTPDWLAGLTAALKKPWLIGEVTVVAGLDNSLEQQYVVGATAISMTALIFVLMLAGLAMQFGRLATQVVRLRRIISGAVEWKSIRRVHILFSQAVSAPFSTRALGRNHVVLPYQLLDSPRNLRLAVKHELQHLRNGDLEWVILLEAIKTLCFWNPAVYLWHNEFDCLQEFACDEVLIRDRQVSSQAYGSCLLEVASASSGSALIAASNMVPKFALLKNRHSQLKRRILMLTNVSNKKYASLKSLGYGLLVGFGLVNTAVVVFAADDDSAKTNSPNVIYRSNPNYPAKALEEKLVGWVQVKFTIDETGGVRDPVVVKNCVRPVSAEEAACTPDDIFDEVTLTALSAWKYEPKTENEVAVKREGVQTIMRYELDPGEPAEAGQ